MHRFGCIRILANNFFLNIYDKNLILVVESFFFRFLSLTLTLLAVTTIYLNIVEAKAKINIKSNIFFT